VFACLGALPARAATRPHAEAREAATPAVWDRVVIE
jgi:hypothetical protein